MQKGSKYEYDSGRGQHHFDFPDEDAPEVGELVGHHKHGAFFGELHLVYIDGRRWRVINTDKRPFGYIVPEREEAVSFRGARIVPHNNYVSDLASTHYRIVRWLLPSAGDGKNAAYGPAAVIHDYLYYTHKIGDAEISRKLADRIFQWAMLGSGVSKWRARLMYAPFTLADG